VPAGIEAFCVRVVHSNIVGGSRRPGCWVRHRLSIACARSWASSYWFVSRGARDCGPDRPGPEGYSRHKQHGERGHIYRSGAYSDTVRISTATDSTTQRDRLSHHRSRSTDRQGRHASVSANFERNPDRRARGRTATALRRCHIGIWRQHPLHAQPRLEFEGCVLSPYAMWQPSKLTEAVRPRARRSGLRSKFALTPAMTSLPIRRSTSDRCEGRISLSLSESVAVESAVSEYGPTETHAFHSGSSLNWRPCVIGAWSPMPR